MQVHNLTQGSPEWHAYRRNHFNASDAPAMLGCSPYKTRDQLIAELATGIVPDVDAATQRIFDAGHRFEALARPLAEQIIGEELAPLVGSEGKYSASFDGLTLMEDTAFEHKTLNKDLRAVMVDGCTGAQLPKLYRVQMEQQCMVAGATRVLFMASKWEGDELVEMRHCWYTPDLTLRAEIVAGWIALEQEVAAYVPAAVPVVVTARVREALPALVFEVRGEVTSSNLADYKALALQSIEEISSAPTTDQEFADAKEDAAWLRGVQQAAAQGKADITGRMTSIDEALKVLDHIEEMARRKAVAVENAVEAEEKRRKLQMVLDAQKDLAEHVEQLNKRLGENFMPVVSADFAGAIKGKRNPASMQEAINTLLVNTKLQANATADRIQINMKALVGAGDKAAFPDAATLVLKATDDLAAIIANRVTAEQQRQEAERERIRKEEADRADREAREKLAAEESAAQAAITQAAKTETLHPAVAADLGGLVREQHAEAVAGLDAQQVIGTAQRAAAMAPAAPAARTGVPTLRIGVIKERLQHMSVTAEDLRALGIKPSGRERGAPLYHEDDFPEICEAIAAQAMAAKAQFLRDLAVVAA